MGSVCASRDDAKAQSTDKDLHLNPPDTPRAKSKKIKKLAKRSASAPIQGWSSTPAEHSSHSHHGHHMQKSEEKEHRAQNHKNKSSERSSNTPKCEPRNWQDHLPLPMPVLISMLFGAAGGHYLSWHIFIGLFLVICAVTPFVYNLAMGILGKSIKGAIEKFDRKIIGVDVHLGKIDVSICYGIVTITDLVIDNPEPFKCEYLLKAARVIIDVDIQEMILSRGMHIVIEELELDEVDAMVEFTTMCMTGKNNFDYIAEHLERFKPAENSRTGKLMGKMNAITEALSKKQHVSLRKVGVIDLGAKVTNQTIGTRIACSDIRYKNFEEEVGANAMDEVIHCLVNSICKSIMVNIGGKAFC